MANVDVTTPSDREIKVTRSFNASAQDVFDAHTQPPYIQTWLLGPPGWSMPVCNIDLKVGGTFRYVWREDGGQGEFGISGTFREIVAPSRIVHVERMDGVPGEALITLTLVENGGRTTLTMVMAFASKEARDGALQSGMTDGMAASYDRLEDVMKRKIG